MPRSHLKRRVKHVPAKHAVVWPADLLAICPRPERWRFIPFKGMVEQKYRDELARWVLWRIGGSNSRLSEA